jgi:hypothetical protein
MRAREGIANVARRMEVCQADMPRRFSEMSVVLVRYADVIMAAMFMSLGLRPEHATLKEVSPA